MTDFQLDETAGADPAGSRRPRVLHIGNIANNAYINAKLLNDAGYDCDVICADYYHIMGCPEWEDADFEGDFGDQFLPQWWRLDLHGFARPAWFAQGPKDLCIRYLLARRSGDAELAARLWDELGRANNTRESRATFRQRLSKMVLRLRLRLSRLRTPSDLFAAVWLQLETWAAGRVRKLMVAAIAALIFLLLAPVTILPLWIAKSFRWLQLWWLNLRSLHGPRTKVAWGLMTRFGCRHGAWGWVAVFAVAPLVMAVAAVQEWREGRYPSSPSGTDRLERLVADFVQAFPDRDDVFTIADGIQYVWMRALWSQLFAHYDLIVAYSTDGFLPLLAGKPYMAFEHGTLREIPFQRTPEGRRTALAYHFASHVFVTNFDCAANAERLAPGRHTEINHPFDEDHGLQVQGFAELRAELCAELQSDYLFFFPTRHDWVAGTGYADKGNDVFLRAFATVNQTGIRAGLICCEWGANVADSKTLLEELGVRHAVKWIAPLPTVRFERMARACDCVVDQFVLGSFGGVMFKAMAVGAPVLTYLDEAQLLRQYPEVPPVVNCRTEAEIVHAIRRLAIAPEQTAEMGRRAREWMIRYHGKRETVAAQTRIFDKMLRTTS